MSKTTGIVRRIDELGRIVIPKEIRRTLRIRETDPMEIFAASNGEIVLKKYSPLQDFAVYATEFAQSLAKSTGKNVCISDKERVIAAAGPDKKSLKECHISNKVVEALEKRKNVMARQGEDDFLNVFKNSDHMYAAEVISPIISAGDVLGAVIMLPTAKEKAEFGEAENRITQMAADFLGKQLES